MRVYEWDGAFWGQMGEDIDGEAAKDRSGSSLSLSSDGTRVAIGATQNGGNGRQSGHVRVYEWNGQHWAQLGKDIDGKERYDHSGKSVSLSSDGARVAIGAHYNGSNGKQSGHVRVYEWNGQHWVQLGKDIEGEKPREFLGKSVSLSSDGNRIAIGAPGNRVDDNTAGHVRIYEWDGTFWIKTGKDIDGEFLNDESGSRISLSSDGSRVAIGSVLNYEKGFLAGHVRIYDLGNLDDLDESKIKIFPNPATEKIQLDCIGNQMMDIYDNLGRIIWESIEADQELDVSDLAPGIYFIQINSGNQSVIKKFIKI